MLALALLLGFETKALAASDEASDNQTVPQTETGTDTVSFPETGQVVNGFEALEIRDFPMINASVVRFMHQKTRAELYYIANDDINRVFDLTFRTKAPDDTGFSHCRRRRSCQYRSGQVRSDPGFFRYGRQEVNGIKTKFPANGSPGKQKRDNNETDSFIRRFHPDAVSEAGR